MITGPRPACTAPAAVDHGTPLGTVTERTLELARSPVRDGR
jgi:hypothetical protein